ncbi:MAG: ABC transporter substrate-binding protein [Erysipelotrichaceae bacterium]|nr:ABC transporter substrate-binding protein [Erysipelotrichaceae bacterium]
MKKLLVVLLGIMMVFGLVGCGSKTEDNAPSTGGGDEAKASFKLGCSGPLTGGAAVYGNDVKWAAEMAVAEINEKEGYNFFEFRMEDDEADPEKAPNAYGALTDWGMQVSLYTVTSGAGLAVSADYNADRVFALTPSGSNPGLAHPANGNYDNLFQVCFTDPNLGTASADYISSNTIAGMEVKKVAVIYRSDDDYSTSIYNTFMSKAAEVGLEVVYEGSFINSDADYSTQLTGAAAAGAELVFLPIYYGPAATILTQAAAMTDFNPVFFGVDGMDGILGLEGFDHALAEGVYLLTPFAADAKDDATVHFVTGFEAAHGSTPTQFAADAYDGVYAIYNALKATGCTADMDAATICDKLVGEFTTMTFEGLTGTANWAENGEVSKTPKAVIITDGVYVAAE